jgi:hypothetical protein
LEPLRGPESAGGQARGGQRGAGERPERPAVGFESGALAKRGADGQCFLPGLLDAFRVQVNNGAAGMQILKTALKKAGLCMAALRVAGCGAAGCTYMHLKADDQPDLIAKAAKLAGEAFLKHE